MPAADLIECLRLSTILILEYSVLTKLIEFENDMFACSHRYITSPISGSLPGGIAIPNSSK